MKNLTFVGVMIHYFKLQQKIIFRHIHSWGLNPYVGLVIGVIAFIFISVFLFYKTEYAEYIYSIIALSIVYRLNNQNRIDFLRQVFSEVEFRKLRLHENVIFVLPFVLILIFKSCYLTAGILILLSLLISYSVEYKSNNFTIPTPFEKKPFEFIIGFRNTFLVLCAAYVLTIIAVSVNNFNLGIFAIGLIFFISAFFYSEPEQEVFIWMFNFNAKEFLLEKIKTSIIHSSVLVLPSFLIMGIFFPESILIILLVVLIGYFLLSLMILAKYSSYPHQMNLPQGLLIYLSIQLPPLILVVIPIFYKRAIRNLNKILL